MNFLVNESARLTTLWLAVAAVPGTVAVKNCLLLYRKLLLVQMVEAFLSDDGV